MVKSTLAISSIGLFRSAIPIIVLTISFLIRTQSQGSPVSLEYIGLNNSTEKLIPYYSQITSNNSKIPSKIRIPKDFENETATVHGIRVEDEVSYDSQGIGKILAGSIRGLRLFGDRFTSVTIIRFVTEVGTRGEDCDDKKSTKSFKPLKDEINVYSAKYEIQLPSMDDDDEYFYICVKEETNSDMPWIHQGADPKILLTTYKPLFPLWLQIVFIVILLVLSGLFSGLNLGLMSLDRTEMKIVAATGSVKEQSYAKAIQPLRNRGNYLLCTLLLGNVMVNSTLTILLDGISSGLIAVMGSTLSIVIFGEIIPQAVCSRHGLAVGAKTIWLTKLFMIITFPLSFPISVLLDKILGEEIGNVYNRERLKELIRVTHDYNDLEKDEINIIAGALELKQKTVADVMTKVEKAFMLPITSVLDFDTVSEIMSQGYSRIPIYEDSKNNIVSLLYTKDLAFVDPDDKMPLKSICEFYNNPIMYVFEATTLDIVFRDFKTGNKGHMAFVQRINEGEKGTDPFYEVIGLVTLEDVIEALIQAEINDETDVYDTLRRRRSKANFGHGGMSQNGVLSKSRWKCDESCHVSPQLILAAFQYLSTAVEQFNSKRISKSILQRLLNQNLFFQIKVKGLQDFSKSEIAIYERGKPADYFVLILEGRVQVEMGRENLIFESGPFSFFGVHILTDTIGIGETPTTPTEIRKFGQNSIDSLLTSTFIPDYSVRPVTDTTFLKISKSMYLAAKQATMLEKAYSTSDATTQNQIVQDFENEIDKMMFSISEETIGGLPNFYGRKSSIIIPTKDTTISPRNNTNPGLLSEILLNPNHLIEGFDLKSSSNILEPSTNQQLKFQEIVHPNNNIRKISSIRPPRRVSFSTPVEEGEDDNENSIRSNDNEKPKTDNNGGIPGPGNKPNENENETQNCKL